MLQKKNPKFLEKLFDLLECNECRSLKWNSKGDGFEINDIEKVEQQILQVYYKQGSFSSFVRQLNLYGFQRIKPRKGVNIFKHEHFKRGNKNELINIVSQNRLKTYNLIINNEENLKQNTYELEHEKLAETLKQLQSQQKLIYSQFKDQISIQLQIKSRIVALVKSIYGFDIVLNQLAFNTQVLLLKLLQTIPNDEKHAVEMNFLKDVCRALSELYIDSLNSYLNSPFSNKLTPIPFTQINSQQMKLNLESKNKQIEIMSEFYQNINQLYAPYLKQQ